MIPLDELRKRWAVPSLPVPDLSEARLVLHWASQPVAAAGHSLADPQNGDAHTAMEWVDDLGAFLGTTTRTGFRAGLRLHDLTLIKVRDGGVAEEFALVGRTLADAMAWMGGAESIATPGYEMPAHAVGDGAPFPAPNEAHVIDLVRSFGNAHALLAHVAAAERRASSVRCWPHHFDIATLISFDAPDAEHARFVGVGLSPGDESYPQPYWYVNPWPYPADDVDLPELAGGGHWHRDAWTGAVLSSDALRPEDPAAQAASFVDGALAAEYALFGVDR